MANDEKIQKNIEIIRDQLFRGWVAYVTACETVLFLDEDYQHICKKTLAIVHITSTENAILALAKILSEDRKSVQINYLLNIIESDRNRAIVKQDRIIERIREELEKLREIIDQITFMRNKYIAHLDRVLMEATQVENVYGPVDMQKVEEVYINIMNILNYFCDVYHCNRLNLLNYRLVVTAEWKILIDRSKE